MARILIVDDEKIVRVLGRQACTRLGHEVLEAKNLADGLELAAEGVDLVLLDVMLPDGDGIEQVGNFSAMPGTPDILIVTGFGHGEGAAVALESGALDYLVKPLQLKDIEQVVQRSLSWRQQRQSRATHLAAPEIIGKSKAILEVLERLAQAAASDVNVLLLGETGAGKEVFARALHANSLRRDKPCVTLDCASLPPSLLAAHLFGHAKGAFTGADRSREGILRAADQGTLFLDEVGELPLDLQGAFLRALDVRRFRPVGEKEEVSSDFRLVAATNKDLAAMAGQGTFRGDLLYRLRGVTIGIPPLRQRPEDIPLLVDHFLEQDARKKASNPKVAEESFLELLMAHTWPGNVRELGQVVQSAVVLAGKSETVHVHHLPQELRIAISRRRFSSPSLAAEEQAAGAAVPAVSQHPAPLLGSAGELPPLKECRRQTEAAYLEELLRRSGHDMTSAAKLAGVSRGHLYELLRKHGLS